MSSDTRAPADGPTPGACTYCGQSLSEQLLALQTYPDSESDSLTGLVNDGLVLCPECAAEPVALLESWTPHGPPPVAAERPIGDSYRECADSCSFCNDSLDSDAIVGVECYRRPGERLPAYANYTLCEECQGIYSEFLCNLRESVE